MMSKKILVDSGFLIALYDVKDLKHEAVFHAASLYEQDFIIPQVILTEVVYLIKRDHGIHGAVAFMDRIIEEKKLLQEITYTDIICARSIMQKYASCNFDFVDCCIMALAERLKISQIATIDSDFYIYRPSHVEHFDFLL